MHSLTLTLFHTLLVQALATDSADALAEKLVDKLIDRVTNAPIDLADLEQTTLAKPALGSRAGLISHVKPATMRFNQPLSAQDVVFKPTMPSLPHLASPLANVQPQVSVNAGGYRSGKNLWDPKTGKKMRISPWYNQSKFKRDGINGAKLEGLVVSDVNNKTIVVQITRRKLNQKYKKTMVRTKKLHAHDEDNKYKIGDYVKIAAVSPPFTKMKAYRAVGYASRHPEQDGK